MTISTARKVAPSASSTIQQLQVVVDCGGVVGSDIDFVSARGQRNPEFLLVRTREERQALERAAAEAAERAAGARS